MLHQNVQHGGFYYMETKNQILWGKSFDGYLFIVDVSNPLAPDGLQSPLSGFSDSLGQAACADKFFVTRNNGQLDYYLADKDNFTLLGTKTTEDHGGIALGELACFGDTLYVGSQTPPALLLFNAADSSVSQTGTVPLHAAIKYILNIGDKYLILQMMDNTFDIYNRSGGIVPTVFREAVPMPPRTRFSFKPVANDQMIIVPDRWEDPNGVGGYAAAWSVLTIDSLKTATAPLYIRGVGNAYTLTYLAEEISRGYYGFSGIGSGNLGIAVKYDLSDPRDSYLMDHVPYQGYGPGSLIVPLDYTNANGELKRTFLVSGSHAGYWLVLRD